jgi:hypothetical protein
MARTTRIFIRLSAKEKENLRFYANQNGLSISEYIRKLISLVKYKIE